MIYNVINRTAIIMMLCVLCIFGAAIKTTHAETPIKHDDGYSLSRVAIAYSTVSFKDAEKKAQEIMKAQADASSCAEAFVTRTLEDPSRANRLIDPVFGITLHFVCSNDPGITIKKGPSKRFPYHYFAYMSSETKAGVISEAKEKFHSDLAERKDDLNKTIKEECGIGLEEFPKNWEFKPQAESAKSSDREKIFGGMVVYNWDVELSLECPTPQTKVEIDGKIPDAKDSPDPKIHWHGEKWWSDKSFEAAKKKVDATVARKNVCQMRGGAVDFKYTEEKSAFYWVSVKYRCRYD